MRTVDVRHAFLEGAQAVLRQCARPLVSKTWSDSSALDGMTVGALVSHMYKCLALVEELLDAPLDDGPTVDSTTFYARLVEAPDPSSAYNAGIKNASEQLSTRGHLEVVQDLGALVKRLPARLGQEPRDRVVFNPKRQEQMLLNDYLETRCVEIATHLDDLAVSLGMEPSVPRGAAAIAVSVMASAAADRHGELPVLRTMVRSERSEPGIFPVL